MKFNKKTKEYIERVITSYSNIPQERRNRLTVISNQLNTLKKEGNKLHFIFICTHNSRRSHFAQIWAQIACIYFGKTDIKTFSGGTEATAFNKNAIEALKRSGMEIPLKNESNPHYDVIYSDDNDKMLCFSKRYSESPNPKEGYIAVMVCSDADQNCPYIPEAKLRVSLPFEDPKNSDGTANEQKAYDFTCLEIASQMFYLISRLK